MLPMQSPKLLWTVGSSYHVEPKDISIIGRLGISFAGPFFYAAKWFRQSRLQI